MLNLCLPPWASIRRMSETIKAMGRQGQYVSNSCPGLSGMALLVDYKSICFHRTPIGAVIAAIGLARLTPLISFFKDTAIGADIASRQVEDSSMLTRFRDKINEIGRPGSRNTSEKLVDAHGKFIKLIAAPFLVPVQKAIDKYNELSKPVKSTLMRWIRINDQQVSFQ